MTKVKKKVAEVDVEKQPHVVSYLYSEFLDYGGGGRGRNRRQPNDWKLQFSVFPNREAAVAYILRQQTTGNYEDEFGNKQKKSSKDFKLHSVNPGQLVKVKAEVVTE